MILKNQKELHIRKAISSDAEEMVRYLNQIGGESDNLTYGLNEFRFDAEKERQFIEDLDKNPNSALLVGIIDGEIVSVGNIMNEAKERLLHNATIGISVQKKYWNLGIGQEMMKALIEYAENTKKIRNLTLKVRSDNSVAIRLYKRFGFEIIGVMKEELNVNGEYFDNILMGRQLQK